MCKLFIDLRKRFILPIRWRIQFEKECRETDIQPIEEILKRKVKAQDSLIVAQRKGRKDLQDLAQKELDVLRWVVREE